MLIIHVIVNKLFLVKQQILNLMQQYNNYE
jgi:hypothetical protein